MTNQALRKEKYEGDLCDPITQSEFLLGRTHIIRMKSGTNGLFAWCLFVFGGVVGEDVRILSMFWGHEPEYDSPGKLAAVL